MPEKTYEDGLRDGEIETIRTIVGQHKERLDGHEKRFNWHEGRLRLLERLAWIVVGAYGLSLVAPSISKFLMTASGG